MSVWRSPTSVSGVSAPSKPFLPHREAAEPTHEQLREKYGDEIPEWKINARQYDRVTKSYLANQKSLHRLSLYEARLERSFDRALRDLQRLQAARPPAVPEAEPEPELAAAQPSPEQPLPPAPPEPATPPAQPPAQSDPPHATNSPISTPIRI